MTTLRTAAQQALEFCEFLRREVLLNDWAEGQREATEAALEAALAAPVQDERTTIADLRCAKWLDPECADKGACQSLKFKRSAEPVQEPFALPCPTPKACRAHCCSGNCIPRSKA